jgi:hypothetical protein
MTEWFHAWLHAYLLTQLIEVPLYLRAGRRRRDIPSLAAAFGATTVTHPVLWLCFPWDPAHYESSLVTGELFVVFTEGAILTAAGFRRPLLTSLTVNAISCGAGLVLQWIGFAGG